VLESYESRSPPLTPTRAEASQVARRCGGRIGHIAISSLLFLVVASAAAIADDDAAEWVRDVRPILLHRCASCHGAIRQRAGLRLDTAALAKAGGESGPAIEAGSPGASLILRRVTSADESERMPPASEGVPLTAGEIGILTRWIEGGALAPIEDPPEDARRHWAYQVPTRADPPALARHPIDAFLESLRRERGLSASPPISDDLWLRRVTLDLTGLPPSLDERAAFLRDRSEFAAERVVDRLLASQRHGERWARHWMDVWRYSDWYGLGQELRFSHYHIWRWRDWIVESINEDAGYDDMIVAMLAGDEVAPSDPETLRATGFLVRNWDIFNRDKWLDTTIEHTSRAFLGVTTQCARCHDHKFDPILQEEYFRLRAIFEPYQIRIDRVPGQGDRTKDGLVRVFDDYIERPTYLFVRGDESRPDTTRPLAPGTPAVLGGSLSIEPIALPRESWAPDERPFVIDETRASLVRAVAEARQSVEVASDSAAAVLAAAEFRLTAFDAVLRVEEIEQSGGKNAEPLRWSEAARAAVDAQRRLALADAIVAELARTRELAAARSTLDAIRAASAAPQNESRESALERASAAIADHEAKLAAATSARSAAEAALGSPSTTDYTPRARDYPRAKVTYRDTPPNTPYAHSSTGRRSAFARWIVDTKNPLTARVAVNHIWARHFGAPLVPSMFDFGLRSERPIHHALLDWLAVELQESGWSMKQLHRLIVTSDAYRMRTSPSDPESTNRRLDPDNRYYWKMPPRRMEAEVIRDSLLFLAKRLDETLGGPDLPVAAAEDGRRRTLYYRYARGDQIAFLTMFDAPSVEECYRRHETIVPQQALALYNSKFALDCAEEIAREISRRTEDDAPASDFVSVAFETILGRAPSEAELRAASAELESWSRLAQDTPEPSLASSRPEGGLEDSAARLDSPRNRARAALVHVLINHNDFIAIR
jgi:hypothetical protein